MRTTTEKGSLDAFDSVDLVARATGHLRGLQVDVGSRVKQGEILAEIDDPELAIAVEKARADIARARARVRKAQVQIRVAEAAADVERARVQAANDALAEAVVRAKSPRMQLDRLKGQAMKHPGMISQGSVDDQAQAYESALAGSKTARSQLEVARAAEGEARARIQAAQADEAEAASELQIAEAGLHQAETVAGYAKIRAPFDGIVTRCSYRAGALVRSLNPVVTVTRTDRLRIAVYMPEGEVPYLDRGNLATFRPDTPGAGGVFRGHVARVPYQIEPLGTARTDIELANADSRLRPGQRGMVEIELEAKEGVITIPKSAILFKKEDPSLFCFRVQDGRSVRTPIKVGANGGERTEILDGLSEGDVIITRLSGGISDGLPVTVRPDDPGSAGP